jgi:transposase-like protein
MRAASHYHRHRFPPEIISHCVWLYYRFALSFRDVEEMLAMRGVVLTYETVREWCLKFGSQLIQGNLVYAVASLVKMHRSVEMPVIC